MRKKISLMFAASQLVLMGYAQTPEFDLSEYKLPDLKRHALVTWFDLSGRNSSYKTPSFGGSEAGKFNENYYNTNLLTHYSFYKNTLTKQMAVNGGFGLNSNYLNDKKDKDLKSESYFIAPAFDFSLVNRKYFGSNSFLETDFMTAYSFQKNYYADYDYQWNKMELKEHSFIANVPIKIGKGRIEEVQDARHALYIFDELAKQGRISSSLSKDDVLAFAHLISKLKNKRFFDSRIRKIYEIEAIDSFLVENKYVSQADARYFTTLNDFWDYGGGPVRKSGTRLSGGIVPGYYFKDFERVDYPLSSVRINAFSINAGFDLTYEKPINKYWQNSIVLNGSGGTIVGKEQSSNKKMSIPNLQLGYKQTLGFYPNTRTDVAFSYGANYVQLLGDSDETSSKISPQAWGVKFMSNLSFNYYVSPRVMLSARASLDYIYQDSKDRYSIKSFSNTELVNLLSDNSKGYLYRTNDFSNYFLISLTYSIF